MLRQLIVVAAVLAAIVVARAQEPAPAFRVTARLIVQSVTVKDERGRAIEGLKASDFEITEDGRPQTIAFAEYQHLDGQSVVPLRPLLPEGASGDLRGQPRIAIPSPGDGRYRGRRLLVLYFDLSTMSMADRSRAFAGGVTYVAAHMTSADAIAIESYDGRAVRVHEDFTDDRDRLLAQLRFLAAGGDANGDGVVDEPESGTAFGENDAEFNVFSTDRQLAALQTAIGDLRGIPEQKTLVYFSSSMRLNGADNPAQLRGTINAAGRANVTIHTVDARGLVAAAPLGDATRAAPTDIGLFSGAAAQRLADRQFRSQDTLYALARGTGGAALFDHNDLSMGLVRAANGAASYYLLGYYSTGTGHDGKFHRVRVTLRGRDDARLSYLDGYVADKVFTAFTAADKERQLEEALRLDEPITDVSMAVEINVFRLNRSEYFVPVSVKLPARELELARGRGAARTLIDVIGEVKDDHGITHRNVRDKLDIRLDGQDAQQWAMRPLQYETGFTLLPGSYVLKLLVRDATTGRIGTYQSAFIVRNLERDADVVPISTVVLSNQRLGPAQALHSVRQKVSAASANPLVVAGQRVLPSVTRVFSITRDLEVVFYTYGIGTRAATPITSYVGLYRGDTKVRETATQAAIPSGPARMAPVVHALPLSGLDPGRYECQVTVIDAAAGHATFWRAPIVLAR